MRHPPNMLHHGLLLLTLKRISPLDKIDGTAKDAFPCTTLLVEQEPRSAQLTAFFTKYWVLLFI